AKISKQDLKVGESATLTLTVSGSGNAQMIAEPKLPDLPQFKTYEDAPNGSIQRDDSGISGRKVFGRAMVPLVPGELSIPALELVYFDPERGSYRTSRTETLRLQVAPADGKEDLRLTESVAPSTGKVAVRILADDILPLYRGLDAVRRIPFGERPGAALAAGLATPPLLFLVLLWTQRRKRLFEADSGLRRRRDALKNAQKSLRLLRTSGTDEPAASLASRCLRTYIGDKLNLEGSALTPAETAHHLTGAKVDDALVLGIRRFLEEMEAAQYGGAQVEGSGAAERVAGLLKRLEGVLK
ncbi:MAG: BatD family protein, partial [Acidobacteria bacterium]|nr:BatD family protein [Acidobacteriota bacterium]